MAPAGPPQLRLSADLKLRSQGSLATALSPSPSTQTHEQTKPHAPGRVGLVRTHSELLNLPRGSVLADNLFSWKGELGERNWE
ncbi:hypothetical protein Y1Q_0003294 [Alligator mississippiensis]|uniref:Uncharacterized protein n=1 Tax=Alligator mississippiensis TaxID=8496 RepID=A0A151ME60_ALLMI|nr:hypothetical protein Y1Q_0003294 [Alligator mississippiensis]